MAYHDDALLQRVRTHACYFFKFFSTARHAFITFLKGNYILLPCKTVLKPYLRPPPRDNTLRAMSTGELRGIIIIIIIELLLQSEKTKKKKYRTAYRKFQTAFPIVNIIEIFDLNRTHKTRTFENRNIYSPPFSFKKKKKSPFFLRRCLYDVFVFSFLFSAVKRNLFLCSSHYTSGFWMVFVQCTTIFIVFSPPI